VLMWAYKGQTLVYENKPFSDADLQIDIVHFIFFPYNARCHCSWKPTTSTSTHRETRSALM
jgi:hypothetical protein